MAVWGAAKCSEVSISGRMDSDFFHPEFQKLNDVVGRHKTHRISKQFTISDGNHLSISRHYTTDGEVPYFRGQDINAFFIENANPQRLPKRIFDLPGMVRSHFASEDVLICIVGASTGAVGLVSEGDLPATGSCKIGIIRKKPVGGIDPLYLSAFLRGRYGQYQIKMHSRGTSQGGLILIDLMKLVVPEVAREQQDAVRNLVESAIQKNSFSNSGFQDATKVFEAAVGLDSLTFSRTTKYQTRFNVTSLSDAFDAHRMDAQCFSPEAVFYENLLTKQARCDRLKSLLASVAKGRQQCEMESGSNDYCSIKNISEREIVGAAKASPGKGTPTAKSDDLLLAITGATIGKIGIVKRYEELVFSGDMLRLRANGDINPHYLLLVLTHHLGQVQFNRWITGSTNGHLSPRDVGRVLVPRLAPEKESEIAALVEQSIVARQESEMLLEQAKARVEQLIEEAVAA